MGASVPAARQKTGLPVREWKAIRGRLWGFRGFSPT